MKSLTQFCEEYTGPSPIHAVIDGKKQKVYVLGSSASGLLVGYGVIPKFKEYLSYRPGAASKHMFTNTATIKEQDIIAKEKLKEVAVKGNGKPYSVEHKNINVKDAHAQITKIAEHYFGAVSLPSTLTIEYKSISNIEIEDVMFDSDSTFGVYYSTKLNKFFAIKNYMQEEMDSFTEETFLYKTSREYLLATVEINGKVIIWTP